jgi:hypothetical protein
MYIYICLTSTYINKLQNNKLEIKKIDQLPTVERTRRKVTDTDPTVNRTKFSTALRKVVLWFFFFCRRRVEGGGGDNKHIFMLNFLSLSLAFYIIIDFIYASSFVKSLTSPLVFMQEVVHCISSW